MCTIPKCGSSSWRKFMLYLQFPDINTVKGKARYKAQYGQFYKPNKDEPDPHAIARNGLFHVRNPVTRVLSAWLSKNRFSNDPTQFAIHHDSFSSFIQNLSAIGEQRLLEADPHIRPLHTFCDYSRGAHYDIILRFEHRDIWAPLLLQHLNLVRSLGTRSNVNVDGKDKDKVDNGNRNGDSNKDGGMITMSEAQRQVMRQSLEKLAQGSQWRKSGTGAESMEVVLAHYDTATMALVRRLYAKDITLFGYEEESQLLDLALLLRQNNQWEN
eukprot:gene7144-14542_t